MRKPLRTTIEMADAFGVDVQMLGGLLSADIDAPKPKLKKRTSRTHTSWYDPDELRRWWKARRKPCQI